jgi:hypothetical protein
MKVPVWKGVGACRFARNAPARFADALKCLRRTAAHIAT